ncbi:uncharacterized protein [Diabrotica undecimpunctata]|uniref:uncharacterized protein n=1 Tax=Diabrotica undecimpunctata TaxID=50387 RepID=UPI003B6336AB
MDVVAIQETKLTNNINIKFPGYDIYSNDNTARSGGTAILVKKERFLFRGITVTNTYKPSAISWPAQVIDTHPHLSIYVEDYNSHREQWKYKQCNSNGNALVKWAENEHLSLKFDAKDRPTFMSAAWKKEYNPDLCFVSTNKNGQSLAVSLKVMDDFPHSQHRPVILEAGTQIPIITSIPRPRWNLKKAIWGSFSAELDKTLGWIPPIIRNYKRFVGAVKSTAKNHIPRGYRKEYIPGWSHNSEELYQNFLESGDQELADELLHSLDAARQQKWTETVESLNFQTSSRQAWTLLRKLGSGTPITRNKTTINPNTIASHLVSTSRAPKDKPHTIKVKRELKTLKFQSAETEYSRPFACKEVTIALKDVKPGKAPGFDNIHPDFLITSGKYAREWMAHFFTDIMMTGIIPQELKRSKIIAILKPGKPNYNNPKNYRPIVLL